VSSENAIEIDNVRRTYSIKRGGLFRKTRHDVEALRGISFTVPRGELFGVLGPNGAGKTTLIRILSTLLLPTSGRASVLGLDVDSQVRAIRHRIGILFGGERGLYGRVSAWQNLRYFANLYGIPTPVSGRRIAELLQLVGLSERGHDKVDTFSRGMKQRLHIARVLLHDPEVIFLDEPTIGLDPVGAREIRQIIRRLQSAGRTILLTTHYMAEADELCQRVAIVDRGELVVLETPERLRSRMPELYVLEVELMGFDPRAVDELKNMAGEHSLLTYRDGEGRRLVRIQSTRSRELQQTIPRLIAGVKVGSVVVREPTLEDVYVEVVGRHAATHVLEQASR
jgi:ABC-2 type transport system ATP-binding protein